MANHFFQFKQFTVVQEHCAMKVCTDACLFGAWLANKKLQANNILDIGTGTGLLSLMLAQQNTTTRIDAVEIDTGAAEQAANNFQQSPWQNRLKIITADINYIHFPHRFELIVSNPPFFEQSLASSNQQKNWAHHSEALTLEQLFAVVTNNLSEHGKFAVLLPFYRLEESIAMATDHQLYLLEQVVVQQTPKHSFFRAMLLFGNTICKSVVHHSISIKNEANEYSEAFQNLLKDYYLYL